MKRDMDLIRNILLKVEGGDFHGGVEGHNNDTTNYHKALLIDKGLIEGTPHYSNTGEKPPDIPDLVMIKKITWEGHDFIDGIRTDTKWAKVKGFLAEAGKDLTVETIKFAVQQLFGVIG